MRGGGGEALEGALIREGRFPPSSGPFLVEILRKTFRNSVALVKKGGALIGGGENLLYVKKNYRSIVPNFF